MSDKKKLEVVPDKPQTNYKFIVGTEGGYDYIVVAQNEDVCLGVKPLLFVMPNPDDPDQAVFMLGARIRCAREKMASGEVVSLSSDKVVGMKKPVTLKDAFPIKWAKEDENRVSTEIGVLIPATPWIEGSTEENIMGIRYHWKLYDWLSEYISEDQWVLEQQAFIDFLKDKYHGMVHDIESKYVIANNMEIDADAEISTVENMFQKAIENSVKPKSKAKQKGLSVLKGSKDDPKED